MGVRHLTRFVGTCFVIALLLVPVGASAIPSGSVDGEMGRSGCIETDDPVRIHPQDCIELVLEILEELPPVEYKDPIW